MLPGIGLFALLARATLLCALGLSIYAGAARLLGVREIIEIEGIDPSQASLAARARRRSAARIATQSGRDEVTIKDILLYLGSGRSGAGGERLRHCRLPNRWALM